MTFTTSTQSTMIEIMYLAQSFPCGHNSIKSNNGHDDFRKKQGTTNLFVASDDNEFSKNDNSDAVPSSFPSLKNRN